MTIFSRQSNDGHLTFTDGDGNVITSGNVITTDTSLVGSHFLTSDDGEQVLTKIELDPTGDVSPFPGVSNLAGKFKESRG